MRNTILTVRSIASLTGLVLLPAAGPAFAQSATEPVTELSFDISGVYDDNLARSSDFLALQRGLSQDDFIVSPAVSLNIIRPIGTAEVALSGQIGYVFHSKNSELNRERIGLNGRGRVGLGPCQVSPEVDFQRRQSDLREIVFLPAAGNGSIKNTETVQSYGATIGCGRSPGLEPFAGVTYEKASNSSAIRDRAEYNSLTYRAGIRYSSAALGELSVFGSRKETELSPLAFGAGGDPEYRFDEVGVSFKRDIGARIQATASVGYGKLTSDNLFVDSFKGVTWDLSLNALVGANLRVTASTGRDVGNSLSSDAGFVVTKPHRVRLEYAFSDRARFDLSGGITTRRFGYTVVPSPNAITNETLRQIDGGLSYDIGRRMKVRVFGGYEKRNASGTLFDYSASFAGASLGIRL
jgi:hypothetical protein